MKTPIIALAVLASLLLSAPAQAELRNISAAQISLLRVHDLGTSFGRPGDTIDVEVVIRLADHDGSFGFQLRDDANGPVRQGMLDLLRDAFNHGWPVSIDYDVRPSNDIVTRRNGEILRVWLTKP